MTLPCTTSSWRWSTGRPTRAISFSGGRYVRSSANEYVKFPACTCRSCSKSLRAAVKSQFLPADRERDINICWVSDLNPPHRASDTSGMSLNIYQSQYGGGLSYLTLGPLTHFFLQGWTAECGARLGSPAWRRSPHCITFFKPYSYLQHAPPLLGNRSQVVFSHTFPLLV